MKKLLTLIALLIAITAQAQNFKFNAVSIKIINENQSFNDVEWEDINTPVLISITLDESVLGGDVIIYSATPQEYTLIKSNAVPVYQDREVVWWTAEDPDGVQCDFAIINYNDVNLYDAIQIRYSNMAWMYSIEPR